MLFSLSCENPPISGEGVTTNDEFEQSETQRMAYHLSRASRLGEDIYFVANSSATNGQRILATEYGKETFETYVPCFNAICDHKNRSQCCIQTSDFGGIERQILAFLYDEEPALVIYNNIDTCLSLPYSNYKINLVSENFLNSDNVLSGYMEWSSSDLKKRRSELFIYKDFLYYVEIKGGVRTQYRVSLKGDEPERVFEEDNIIVRTIINDSFYGIRYEVDESESADSNDREKMHYYRSDLNYENVETLPELFEFFYLPYEDNLNSKSNAILDADDEFIYVLHNMKIWKISDSDINKEPVLMSDMGGKIPSEESSLSVDHSWYNGGILYSVINSGHYRMSVLDSGGLPNKVGWYERSIIYCFNIITGECSSMDISSPSYLIDSIMYADDKYVYAEGKYLHDDGRKIEGVTMRLTFDCMRYEVILPEVFFDYSAK